jgi:hypothetical protein
MPGRVRCDAQSERLRDLLRAPLTFASGGFPASRPQIVAVQGHPGPYFLQNAMRKLTLPGGRRCRLRCAPLQ